MKIDPNAPAPWNTENGNIYDATGKRVCWLGADHDRDDTKAAAIAERIVRAVNAIELFAAALNAEPKP